MTSRFDSKRADAFAERMTQTLNDAFVAMMLSIGHQTGLLEKMAVLPASTSDEIAKACGLDARNVVANFISLVESGNYAGTRFSWCEGGRRVLGGDPNTRDEDPHNDGFGDPGYLIESEPGRRLNLAYMVAFTDKRRARRTEGCTFVIHMAPFPALDGVNTVFGRVIEGHATVRKLEYYDAIEATEVVRKRDHAYEPIKRPAEAK